MTTSFWWCDPPRRTRSSSRASPPASVTSTARCRFSFALNASRSLCERQSSPRTSAPRRHRSAMSVAIAGPPSARYSSPSPLQSVKRTASPGPRLERTSDRRAKYVAPSTRNSTWLPSVHATPPGRPESILVIGLPRSSGSRNQSWRRTTVTVLQTLQRLSGVAGILPGSTSVMAYRHICTRKTRLQRTHEDGPRPTQHRPGPCHRGRAPSAARCSGDEWRKTSAEVRV